jgi:hypothetical protein
MGIFNIFGKSTLKKVTNELIANDLGPMANLLESANSEGFANTNYSEERKKMECEMLKNNYNLQQGPANESLNRFRWAKDICEEHDFIKGARYMQNYIDIYTIYIRKYCD